MLWYQLLTTNWDEISKKRATQQDTWRQKHLDVDDLREICVMVTGTHRGVEREFFDAYIGVVKPPAVIETISKRFSHGEFQSGL